MTVVKLTRCVRPMTGFSKDCNLVVSFFVVAMVTRLKAHAYEKLD